MEELININNVISPYEELLAFETLWSFQGMTDTKMSRFFKEGQVLPSKLLSTNILGPDFKNELESKSKQVEALLKNKLGKFNVCIHGDFQYPEDLRKAQHPIELFYYKGNLDLLSSRSVSIVGARKATPEGILRAKKLTKELIAHDFTIVSGLANGIDTAAHTTAIETNKGQTIGVIGTPIDQYYPKENARLQDLIAENYLLISQVPFYRYEHESFLEHKFHFPKRNVTMAAISEATIIVEASDTSGSLTQARACLQQGKKLFILDSCFERKDITWPATYEKKGAIRIKSTDDILSHLISPKF